MYLTTNKARQYIQQKWDLIFSTKDINYKENIELNFVCHACGIKRTFNCDFDGIFQLHEFQKISHDNHLFGLYINEVKK